MIILSDLAGIEGPGIICPGSLRPTAMLDSKDMHYSSLSRFFLLIVLAASLLLIGCNDEELVSDSSPVVVISPEEAFNTTLVSKLNPRPEAAYSSVWGYTAPDGREYALLGAGNGTSIIDITDAANPVERAFIPGPSSRWRELKAYQHYAYVVTEGGGGLQIIDLSQLPISASLAATYVGFDRAHTVTIDEARGYLYTGGGEFVSSRAFSLADPLNPAALGVFNAPKYVHDQSVQGTLAYLAEGGEGSYSIYDVTNPAAPVRVIHFHAPGSSHGIADPGHGDGSDGTTYAHNIWPVANGSAALTTEEVTGKTVKRWDLSDPAHPRVTAEYLGSNGMAHNVHIKGQYAYLAHYSAGLRVLDLTDPARLPEVAAYQRAGARNSGFNGVWGVYPYFRSGNILLSDIETGLYVVHYEGAEN